MAQPPRPPELPEKGRRNAFRTLFDHGGLRRAGIYPRRTCAGSAGFRKGLAPKIRCDGGVFPLRGDGALPPQKTGRTAGRSDRPCGYGETAGHSRPFRRTRPYHRRTADFDPGTRNDLAADTGCHRSRSPPAVIDALPPETLRNLGLSLRKVGYIRSAAPEDHRR